MLASGRQAVGKDIVIVGDGPAALAIAVKLKQIGVTHVTVVGPRLGEYVRSGDVVPETFERVSKFVAPLSVKPSKGFHLKDIERQLYVYANKLGVSFIKSKFAGFTEQGKLSLVSDVVLQPAQIIQADFVFDCTGEQRSVINSFNQRLSAGMRFDIKTRPGLAKKYFSSVRGMFKIEDHEKIVLKKLRKDSHSHIDSVYTCLNLEKLRQLGWNDYVVPVNYINFAAHMENKKGNFVKGTIYTCVPDDIAEENILPFVQTTVKFLHDCDFTLLKKSEKYPNKKQLAKFAVNLRQVTPAYYPGDESFPVIIHAGDASLSVPFMMAFGVRNSINRIQDIFNNFTINQGVITQVDFNQLSICYEARLKSVNEKLDHFLSVTEPRNDLGTNLRMAQSVYADAYNECTDIENKKIIKAAKDNLDREYALYQFEEGKEEFKKIYSNNLTISDCSILVAQLPVAIQKMLGTLQYQQLFSPEKIQEIETYFADLAETNKSIAHAFFTAPRPLYNLALHYYNAAILIYMNLLPDTSHDRQLPLFSNLIITSRKLNDFISCDKIYNKVRSTLYPTTHQHKALWDKNLFQYSIGKTDSR